MKFLFIFLIIPFFYFFFNSKEQKREFVHSFAKNLRFSGKTTNKTPYFVAIDQVLLEDKGCIKGKSVHFLSKDGLFIDSEYGKYFLSQKKIELYEKIFVQTNQMVVRMEECLLDLSSKEVTSSKKINAYFQEYGLLSCHFFYMKNKNHIIFKDKIHMIMPVKNFNIQ